MTLDELNRAINAHYEGCEVCQHSADPCPEAIKACDAYDDEVDRQAALEVAVDLGERA